MFIVFTSCPRTCTTFLIHCTLALLKRVGVFTKRLPLEKAMYHLRDEATVWVCKVESNHLANHAIIPSEKKILLHSSRNLQDLRKSVLTLLRNMGTPLEDAVPSIEYYQKYDEQGRKECDLFFSYDYIRSDKKAQVSRLVSFFQEKKLVPVDAVISIDDILDYADNKAPLPPYHKNW